MPYNVLVTDLTERWFCVPDVTEICTTVQDVVTHISHVKYCGTAGRDMWNLYTCTDLKGQ